MMIASPSSGVDEVEQLVHLRALLGLERVLVLDGDRGQVLAAMSSMPRSQLRQVGARLGHDVDGRVRRR